MQGLPKRGLSSIRQGAVRAILKEKEPGVTVRVHPGDSIFEYRVTSSKWALNTLAVQRAVLRVPGVQTAFWRESVGALFYSFAPSLGDLRPEEVAKRVAFAIHGVCGSK